MIFCIIIDQMVRKSFVLLIFFLTGVLSFGCKEKKKVETQQKKEKPLTTLLLTDGGGVNDGGFNANAWEGVLKYYGDYGKTDTWKKRSYDTISCATEEQREQALNQNSGKFDLIIATGFNFFDSLTKLAPKFPDQKFALIDTVCGAANIMSFVFTEEEGAFLVGVAAALKAQEDGILSPQFGFIGGESGDTIMKFEVGYFQGIHKILPKSRTFSWYTEDWNAPDKAQEKARDWYNNGVYAIFSAAGGSGLGVIKESAIKRSSGSNVWSIGVDVDQFKAGEYELGKSAVLTSMVKRTDNAVIYALGELKKGTFRGGVVTMDIKGSGVGFTETNSALTGSIKVQLNDDLEKIKSGDIKIVSVYKDAIKKGLINGDFPHCRYDK